jgi:WD40 repeat protein
VDDLAFSSDGALLASMSGGTVTVWDVAKQRHRFALRGGSRGTLRFAPNGSRLGSASQDGTLTVWDLPSGQLLANVKGQSPYNGFPHLTFTPDGAVLASVVPGGGLVLVDMNLARWQREACAIAGRDLTRAEHEHYIGSDLAPRSACG